MTFRTVINYFGGGNWPLVVAIPDKTDKPRVFVGLNDLWFSYVVLPHGSRSR